GAPAVARATIVYCPGGTAVNANLPSASGAVRLIDSSSRPALPEPACDVGVSINCTLCGLTPDGTRTVPSSLAGRTNLSGKSTPIRSSPWPSVTGEAIAGTVVPG